MRNAFLSFAVIGLALASVTQADKPTETAQPKSSQAKAAITKADKAIESAEAAYRKAITEAKRTELAELKIAMVTATKAGNLDEANAIKAACDKITAELDVTKGASANRAFAEIIATGTGFQVQAFKSGAKAYSNRDYVWEQVPKEFEGWSFTQAAGNGSPTINVEAKSAGQFVIAVETDFKIEESGGWKRVGSETFGLSNGKGTKLMFLGKRVTAGEKVELPARQGFTFPVLLLPPAPASAE